MNHIRDEAADNPPKPPAEATTVLFPLVAIVEFISVALGGLKTPTAHDGCAFKDSGDLPEDKSHEGCGFDLRRVGNLRGRRPPADSPAGIPGEKPINSGKMLFRAAAAQ